MKAIYKSLLITALAAAAAGCGDGVDLPAIPCETDITKIPVPDDDETLLIPLKDESVPMVHNGGLLFTYEDYEYVKERLDRSPWKEGYAKLCDNSHSHLGYIPAPQTTLDRNSNGGNFMRACHDVAAAYQHAIRYHLGDGEAYAEEAVKILSSWVNTCEAMAGDSHAALSSGLYGYEFAVAGEMMRDYWIAKDAAGFKAYQEWMLKIFYPTQHIFLEGNWESVPGHYWANWGLANVAGAACLGVVCDRRDIYNEAILHFQTGSTNGNINKAINHVFDGEWANVAQWQESGRDTGHVMLCQGLTGVICQATWGQGDDFFGYDDCRFLKACEYNGAYYSARLDVPFEPYIRNSQGPWGPVSDLITQICDRGDANGAGAIWAIPYNHYAKIKGLDPERYQYSKLGAELSMPEGGGEGGNSGGYDMLGHGTLMFSRE